MSVENVNEDALIGKLLTFSEFDKFYRNEWMPRKTSVVVEWKINPSCSNFAASGIITNGNTFIELPHYPETINDAFLVAHEIVHVIRDLENRILRFPSVNNTILEKYTVESMGDLASRIGSMFDDPIVDTFLQNQYGFDPARHYVKVVIPNTIRSLQSSGDPTDELIRFKQALFFSQCALQWDSIKGARKRAWYELKRMYLKRRPHVKRIGEDLYSMAKENGYDALENQKTLFNKIGDKYTLNDIKIKDILYIG